MKKIISFGGSSSKSSINKQFAYYTANKVRNVEIEYLDLNDFNIPLYSIDFEYENGIPELVKEFSNKIKSSRGIVLSLAEHNGSYSVAFKNLLDWISRLDKKVFQDKPMLLMTTSPGGRGGKTVLETAMNSFSRFGANIVANFSLPSFYDNFKNGAIINDELLERLEMQISIFNQSI